MPYIYAIRDKKADTFDQPFPAVNNSVAIRMFADLANRQDNLIGQHPEDFDLYQLAFFDPEDGQFKASPVSRYGHDEIPPEWTPQLIVTAVACVASRQSE